MWFWLAVLGWAVVIAAFAFNRALDVSTSKRFLVYLVGIPLVSVVVGSLVGASEDCASDADECLAGLTSVFTAGFMIVVGVGMAVTCEAIRAFLRAADRYEQS